MIRGNPDEIRNAAVKAQIAQQSLDNTLRALENYYASIQFNIPNKNKVDVLLTTSRSKLNAAKEQLGEFEKRLKSIAQQLENINRG